MTIARTTGAADARGYQLGQVAVFAIDGEAARISRWLQADGYDTITVEEEAVLASLVEFATPDILFAPLCLEGRREGVIRRVRARTDMPIIAVVPRGADPLVAYNEGADLVVTTPIGRGELIARTRALLRRTRATSRQGDDTNAFGGLELPAGGCVLHIGDEKMDLDPAEAAFFALLISNGPKVTTRSHLADALEVHPRELDGFIRRMRQRLELIEGWRRIVTERGVGVRLLEAPRPTYFTRKAGPSTQPH